MLVARRARLDAGGVGGAGAATAAATATALHINQQQSTRQHLSARKITSYARGVAHDSSPMINALPSRTYQQPQQQQQQQQQQKQRRGCARSSPQWQPAQNTIAPSHALQRCSNHNSNHGINISAVGNISNTSSQSAPPPQQQPALPLDDTHHNAQHATSNDNAKRVTVSLVEQEETRARILSRLQQHTAEDQNAARCSHPSLLNTRDTTTKEIASTTNSVASKHSIGSAARYATTRPTALQKQRRACAPQLTRLDAPTGENLQPDEQQVSFTRLFSQQQAQYNSSSSSSSSMEATQQLPAPVYDASRRNQTRAYPNNTLLADLNKCHMDMSRVWPQPAHALMSSLNSATCWRPFAAKNKSAFKHKTHTPSHPLKYIIPEPLLRSSVNIKPDDYDKALCVLTGDVRFKLHLLLYGRMHSIWLLVTSLLCVVAPICVLGHIELLAMSCVGLAWLLIQLCGAFIIAQCRKKLDNMLERSVAQANSFFMEHNLMLGVINVGSLLSKARLIIPMIYFDTTQCREQIESIMSDLSRKGQHDEPVASGELNATHNTLVTAAGGGSSKPHITLLNEYSKTDLLPAKPNAMTLAQSQLAKKIVLRYSQRWISYFDKRKLMFTDDRTRPRHLSTGKCLCQFIEEQLTKASASVSALAKADAMHKHQRAAKTAAITREHNKNDLCKLPAAMMTTTTTSTAVATISSTCTTNSYANTVIKQHNDDTRLTIEPTALRASNAKLCNSANGVAKARCNLNAQLALSVPALSDADASGIGGAPIVSDCRINHDEFRIDMSGSRTHSTLHSHKVSKSEGNSLGFASLTTNNNNNNNNNIQTKDSHAVSISNGCLAYPTNDAHNYLNEASLVDLPIGRSDDLVKRLRLFLELRKNDLQGLDGSLFASALHRMPYECKSDVEAHSVDSAKSPDSTAESHAHPDKTDDANSVANYNTGNRVNNLFLGHRTKETGLLFLSASSAEKNTQHTNQNHVFKVC